MGRVYCPTLKDQPFEKQVAIKVLASGIDPRETLRRFKHECQVLARLDHPHIARILDSGETAQGLPFIVMEMVRGQDLTTYLAQGNTTLNELLMLFEHVCESVHYAHQNLIIHRDFKPSNMMVTEEGQAVILDFGIAKLFDPGEDGSESTQTRNLRFTPEYASPEQWVAEEITTSVDVYGMGVMLYQALTKTRPYDLWQARSPGFGVRDVLTEQLKRVSRMHC